MSLPIGRASQLEIVVDTASCRPEHLAEVGGKAVGLGALHRAGQRVPPSFVIGTTAFRDYLSRQSPAPPARTSRPRAGLDDKLRRSIELSYSVLSGDGQDLPVAVRSSATVEDSREASGAGQFMTFLGARGIAQVLESVEDCWIAASAPHVGSYTSEIAAGSAAPGVALIVQELVDARAAGVMFTQHPRTGDRSVVVIESSYGLGEAVVGGEVTPDLFEVNKVTRQISGRRLGSKAAEHRLRHAGDGAERRPVHPARQNRWSIADEEVAALLAMALELEERLGRGLDVEWAIGALASQPGADALFALQARPITVAARPASGGQLTASPAVPSGIDLALGRLSGPAGPGARQ